MPLFPIDLSLTGSGSQRVSVESEPPMGEDSRIQATANGDAPPSYEETIFASAMGQAQMLMRCLYCPDRSQPHVGQDWTAVMEVRCSDIPSLLRDGFYWDKDNVRGHHQAVGTGVRMDGRESVGVRHYYLQGRRWDAHITFYAFTQVAFYEFDLYDLVHHRLRIIGTHRIRDGHRVVFDNSEGRSDQWLEGLRRLIMS
ncbi:hypothetical protein F4777DRAFT_574264 [Nemania sp. FL0916]|nr:hypothetical protein F4777DRAFT_574264 [Nemania sp. FL0916]